MLRATWCPHCKALRQVEVSDKTGQVCSFCGEHIPEDTGTKDGMADSWH